MIVPPWRLRLIVGLSLPIVLILLAQTLIGLIAIALVSHLGDAAVAGIGIATALLSMLTALGYIAGPGLFALVTRDAAVAAHGLPYLRATLPMLLFSGANFAFSAYRNGAGTPRYSLLAMAVQLPCSALFGYLLVFGAPGLPPLGTAGAGLGIAFAALVALTVHIVLAWRLAPVPGFPGLPSSWRGMRLILRIGLPVGLQQSLVYVGTAIYYAI